MHKFKSDAAWPILRLIPFVQALLRAFLARTQGSERVDLYSAERS